MALAQNGGIAGFQEVSRDVVGNIHSKTIDQLAQLATGLGVPDGPRRIAFAVSHGVIGPGLESLAGLVFRTRHVGRDFNPWRFRAINNEFQTGSVRLARAVLQVLITGYLIGTLIIGTLIYRRFIRP